MRCMVQEKWVSSHFRLTFHWIQQNIMSTLLTEIYKIIDLKNHFSVKYKSSMVYSTESHALTRLILFFLRSSFIYLYIHIVSYFLLRSKYLVQNLNIFIENWWYILSILVYNNYFILPQQFLINLQIWNFTLEIISSLEKTWAIIWYLTTWNYFTELFCRISVVACDISGCSDDSVVIPVMLCHLSVLNPFALTPRMASSALDKFN